MSKIDLEFIISILLLQIIQKKENNLKENSVLQV